MRVYLPGASCKTKTPSLLALIPFVVPFTDILANGSGELSSLVLTVPVILPANPEE